MSASIEMTYRLNAPNTEMAIISAVWPERIMSMPTAALAIRA
jgi:hypothetical protein